MVEQVEKESAQNPYSNSKELILSFLQLIHYEVELIQLFLF